LLQFQAEEGVRALLVSAHGRVEVLLHMCLLPQPLPEEGVRALLVSAHGRVAVLLLLAHLHLLRVLLLCLLLAHVQLLMHLCLPL